MKFLSYVLPVVLASATLANAQAASSHAPVLAKTTSPKPVSPTTKKVAAKVNGAVLTEAELQRMMGTIFPFAGQHDGGVPKALAPEIRRGALQMLVFEELLYQDAKHRNIQVPPAKLAKAEKSFRSQFPKDVFDGYLRSECDGSVAVLREKIRRSLLIEQMLKTEVNQKARVTLADTKAYYDKNPKRFDHGEKVAIQTISMVPPENAGKEQLQEAKAKITDAMKHAKKTKNYEEFGVLAEQISDDDWRTQMGDHKTLDVAKLPAEVATALKKVKVGQISGIIQVQRAYVIVRLNARIPAGRTPFAEVKKDLRVQLQKQRTEETRSALNAKLSKGAKIEIL